MAEGEEKKVVKKINLTGPQKAAILVASMGEDFTTDVFGKLTQEEVRWLSAAMTRMGNVENATIDTVLGDFLTNFGMTDAPLLDGEALAKSAITKAMSGRNADALLEELERAQELENFERLKTIDSKTFANFIKSEHPQTISVVMAQMPHAKAAEVISEFPENLQYDVALRMAGLDNVPPSVLKEIDEVLKEQLFTMETAETRSVGGVSAVAEILNQVDKATEEAILGRLEEDHPDLAEQVRLLMFVFEDLANIDDRGIRTILKEVKNEDLTMALKTASNELRDKILSNVSERAAAMINEDLEVMGPVRLSDVEHSQQAVIQVARRLEKEGKIVISKGGEDVFV